MNKTQKLTLVFAATTIFLMMLFPPCNYSARGEAGAGGYRFILDHGGNLVNVQLLLAQWICVSLIIGIIYFIAKHDDFLNDSSNVFLQRCRKYPVAATIVTETVLIIFGLIFLTGRFTSITAWLFLTIFVALGMWWILEHWDTQ